MSGCTRLRLCIDMTGSLSAQVATEGSEHIAGYVSAKVRRTQVCADSIAATCNNVRVYGERPARWTIRLMPRSPIAAGRQRVQFPRRKCLHLAVSATALPSLSRRAWAQAYPSRPVRAVVAFAPGGVTDTFGRLMAQKLTEQFGKQFYVENIAGATGNIGTAQVAQAAPDGYTLLFAFSSHGVNPTPCARLPYAPINDFKPVTLAVASTTVLTVNPTVPAKTLDELIALIRANPGKYSFGS